MLSREEAREEAEGLGYPCAIPVVKVLTYGQKTPAEVYQELRKHSENSFLLESAIGGEKIARYSFLGAKPEEVIEIKEGYLEGEKIDSPLNYLQSRLNFKVSRKRMPRFFGGLVGFFGYDYVRYLEEIGGSAGDDLQQGDLYFFLVRDCIVFDHYREEILLISNLFLSTGEDMEGEYSRSRDKIEFLERVVKSSTRTKNPRGEIKRRLVSNFSREGFMEAVKKAKEYIHQGEIFQVVLSQRFSTPFKGDAFGVYLALKLINPSPYMYCFESRGLKVVGSSPEILVKCEGRKAVVRPIAGTRPRGKDVVEDEALSREMVNDEKERAEHVMLVDLGRNDLGKVAKFGSVEVTDFMNVEKYSHVQHIVSNIRGEMEEGKDSFSALEAAFPAGTVSGAPKVRAMEIIEELEPTRRGVYAGALGYFSLDGNMDFAIAIRTIVVQGGRAYLQAGAGVVADSQPEREYQECVNKGKAMLRALEMVEDGREPGRGDSP